MPRRWLFRLTLSLLLILLALSLLSEFTRIHYSSNAAPPQLELDLSRSTLTITRDTEQLEKLGYSLFYFEEGWTFTRRYLNVGGGRQWLPSIDTVTWACRTTTITLPLYLPLAAAALLTVLSRPRSRTPVAT